MAGSSWWDNLPSREEIENADPGHGDEGLSGWILVLVMLYAFENIEEIISFMEYIEAEGGHEIHEWDAEDADVIRGVVAHSVIHLVQKLQVEERRSQGRKGRN